MKRSPIVAVGEAVKVAVHLTPNASASRIVGIAADAGGNPILKAQVTEVPEQGKANAALIGLLAKTWKLPKTSLSIVSGAASRRKVILITGTPDVIVGKFHTWLRTRQ